MRSYAAARMYFSILSFFSWAIIVIGGIVTIGAVAAVGNVTRGIGVSSGGLEYVGAMLPGLGMMFVGFLGLVGDQIGRAAVDTAEYTQQGLQITREQLEISRQSLKQGSGTGMGYAALEAAKAEIIKPDSEAETVSSGFAALTSDTAHSNNGENVRTKINEVEANGRKIAQYSDGSFELDGKVYSDLDEVRTHLRLEGVRRGQRS